MICSDTLFRKTTLKPFAAGIALAVLMGTGSGVTAAPPAFSSFTYPTDDVHIGNYTSHTRDGNTITIAAGSDKARVIVCEHDVIRVAYGPGGVFTDFGKSYAVQKWTWNNPVPVVDDRTSDLVITTDSLYVRVWKNPVRFEFYNKSAVLLNRDKFGLGLYPSGTIEVNKYLPSDEHIYGLGERVGARLDHRGYQMLNWSYDSYDAKNGMGYKAFTLWLSNKGYGIFIDNFARATIDIGKAASDEMWAEFAGGKMEYYFFQGSMKNVLDRYTELTGRPYMAPKWALGYQQCKWAFNTREELLEMADSFRSREIPCDALWLDAPGSGWWKNNINWTGEFDDRYPDPAGMIAELHSKGFTLSLLENQTMDVASPFYQEGAANSYYVKNQDGSIFISQQWNGDCATVDFTNPGAAAWFAGLHKGLADMGIDGWWIDMNDGGFPESRDGYINRVFAGGLGWKVHNCNGGLLDADACYRFLKSYKPDVRPFYMTRGGASGMQRSAWTWSADLRFLSWDDLSYQLRMEQNMGLCGVVYSSDIGGCNAPLEKSPNADRRGEGYLRWMQMSLFNFFTRTHFNGGSVDEKYPWTYGPDIEAHVKKWIEWKYRMMPYIYTEHYNYTRNGSPIHRALVYSYPNDSKVYTMADEFMFGDWMLIAPVVTGNDETGASDTRRDVYLPAGTWVDYTDGKTVYTGPKTLSNYAAPLGTVPMFVKPGAIIPMQPVMQYAGQLPSNPITLDVYPAANSSYTMYEDDGISFKHEQGNSAKTKFDCRAGTNAATVTVNARKGTFNPGKRDYMIKMHLVEALASVILNGTDLERKSYAELSGGQTGWNYDAENKIGYARFADNGGSLSAAFLYTETGVGKAVKVKNAAWIDVSPRGSVSAFSGRARGAFTLTIVDARGKIAASVSGLGTGTLRTDKLSAGSYVVRLKSEGVSLRKNLTVLGR